MSCHQTGDDWLQDLGKMQARCRQDGKAIRTSSIKQEQVGGAEVVRMCSMRLR